MRSDYGDYPDHIVYTSEAHFLEALRKFYDRETSKNVYPENASEFVAWKLMLRLLRKWDDRFARSTYEHRSDLFRYAPAQLAKA